MIRRLTVALALLMGSVVAFGGTPASATFVDYAGCSLSVEPFLAVTGNEIEVSGSGFEPGTPTDIVLSRFLPDQAVLGTAIPDQNGEFEITVELPNFTRLGLRKITARCSSDIHAGFGFSLVFLFPNLSPNFNDITSAAGDPGTTGIGSSGGTGTPGGTGGTGGSIAGRTLPRGLSLSSLRPTPLQKFVATITGAKPGSSVEFARFSTRTVVGSAVADENGVASLPIAFPKSADLGAHHVEAKGVDAAGVPFTYTAPVELVASSEGSGAGLPRTGSDTNSLTVYGGGALLAGLVLVTVARRRRATASHS